MTWLLVALAGSAGLVVGWMAACAACKLAVEREGRRFLANERRRRANLRAWYPSDALGEHENN